MKKPLLLLLLLLLLPVLLAVRVLLEFHFWRHGPVSAEFLLERFMTGYRLDTALHQKGLRKPRKNGSAKGDRWMFRIAFPRSVCADVYKAYRKEDERQRRWIEATETSCSKPPLPPLPARPGPV